MNHYFEFLFAWLGVGLWMYWIPSAVFVLYVAYVFFGGWRAVRRCSSVAGMLALMFARLPSGYARSRSRWPGRHDETRRLSGP